MKMKRILSLLLAAVMLFGCALAEPETVVTLYDENGEPIDEKTIESENPVKLNNLPEAATYVVHWSDGEAHDDQNLIKAGLKGRTGEDFYSAEVNGNIATTNLDAIDVQDGYYDITVNGNVSSTGSGGIMALRGKGHAESTLTVNGDVTVDASALDATAIQVGNANVIVNGDVTATNEERDPYYAINVEGDGSIVITGDLTVSNFKDAVQIRAAGGANVEIGGNIENEADEGVHMERAWSSTVSVGGNVTGDYGIWNESGKDNQLAVGGDVTAGVYGIQDNFGTGNQVTVGGDVNGGEMGIRLIGVDGDTISVEGNVSGDECGIEVQDSENVTIDVGGDVTSGTAGLEVLESTNTTVNVEGDVSGEVAIVAIDNEDTTITVGGNATGSWFGVETDNMTELFIGDPGDDTTGNVTVNAEGEVMDGMSDVGSGVGIMLLSDRPAEGTVQITGTVTSGAEAPALLIINEGVNVTAENIGELLPETTVFELAPADGENFVGYMIQGEDPTKTEMVTDQSDPIVTAIAEAIQYIVKIADDSKDKVTVSGTSTNSTGLTVAKENDKLQVQVAAGDGAEIESLTAGDYATVTKNGDGTWTITVVRGGGIVISATLAQAGSSLYDSIGQYYLYGKYLPEGANPETDEKEDLVWRCIGIYSGHAKLALVRGFETMPEDFAESFTEEEMAGIKDGEIKELEPEKVERLFNDNLVHPVILVDVWSLGIW